MRAIILIILLVVVEGARKDDPLRPSLYLFPDYLYGNWTNAYADDIRCPELPSEFTPQNTTSKTISVGIFSTHPELNPVEGFLCTGYRYVTYCYVGFLGEKTIISRILRIQVSRHECEERIVEMKTGSYLEPFFPAESCYWMRENEETKDYMVIHSHSIHYNPYSGMFIDGLFGERGCRDSVCPTVHENTYWFSDNYAGIQCGQINTITAVLYSNQYGEDLYIKYNDRDTVGLTDACRLTYCGHSGIRLKNGKFLIDGKIIKKNHICSPSIPISFTTEDGKIDRLNEEFRNLEELYHCMRGKGELMRKNVTDFFSLSYFEPKIPGNWPAYRIHNGHMEKIMARWIPLYRFGSGRSELIGYDGDNHPHYWRDWVPSGKDGLLSGFNGVHKLVSGTVIVPRKDILALKYSESAMIEHEVNFIEHPKLKSIEEQGLDNEVTSKEKKNTLDVESTISELFSSMWGKVVIAILAIVIILILVFIIKTLIIRMISRRKTNESVSLAHLRESTSSRKNILTAETSFSQVSETKKNKKSRGRKNAPTSDGFGL